MDLPEPVLEVGEISEDFDPLIPPSNGQEYLQRVIIEASKCQDVVVARIDKLVSHQKPINLPVSDDMEKAPNHIIPSKEWQVCQVADFSDVRKSLTKSKQRQSHTSLKLPDKDDQNEWYVFCYGQQSPESAAESCSAFGNGSLPLTSVLSAMNQPLIERLLEYHIDWIQERNFTKECGCWLYALLACLELPLKPETCSVLRSLARECAKKRSMLREQEDISLIQSINLIICLVANYFRQVDLADI